MDELRSLREARDAVDDQIQRMQWGLGPCPPPRTPNPATPSVSPQETIVDEMSTRSLFTPASPLLVHTSLSPCPPPPPPPQTHPLFFSAPVLPKKGDIPLIFLLPRLWYKHGLGCVCPCLMPQCPALGRPPFLTQPGPLAPTPPAFQVYTYAFFGC